jgi:Tol biopolymer transport system component
MSPEQAQGCSVDTRSDIFSFGCVLYEAIAGRRAFPGSSTGSVLLGVLEKEPEPLTGVPEELTEILARCMKKDAARRWQHAGDLRIALEDLRASPATRARPRARTRLSMGMAAAAMALLGIGALAAWFWQGTRSVRFDTFAPATDGRAEEMSPALAPDGKTLVYAARASGLWDIYSLRVGGTNPVNLTGDSKADNTEPAFSPNGEKIAFRSEREGGGIFVMGATGESVRRVTDFCYLPAWSPDGREIACSTATAHRPDLRDVMSSQVYVVDAATGNRRLVSGVVDAVQASWSPDGRRIAFWGVREGARDIFTVGRDGGEVTPVTSDEAADWSPVWAPDGKYLYFSSDRGGSMNLWRVRVNTSSGKKESDPEPVNVPANYAAGISFSRDGEKMAYTNWLRNSNLYLAPFEAARGTAGRGRAVTQGLKETLYPALSHDGKWIAFTLQAAGDNIAVVSADGGQTRRVTDDTAHDVMPAWSPGGNEIAFISNRTGHAEVWAVRRDGSGLREITYDSPRGGVLYPAWSPDGARLSYNLPDEMGYIISMKKAWKDQQPLLARVSAPEKSWFRVVSWSENGESLAGTMQKTDGGTSGVGVYTPATRSYAQWTSAGQSPRWLPEGKGLLFYLNGAICETDGPGGKVKQVLGAEQGSISPYFDVSRDGREIVYSLELMESNIWIRSRR